MRRRTRKNTLSTEHGRAFIFSPSTSTTAGSGFVAEYQSELLESTSNTQVRASATAVSPSQRHLARRAPITSVQLMRIWGLAM